MTKIPLAGSAGFAGTLQKYCKNFLRFIYQFLGRSWAPSPQTPRSPQPGRAAISATFGRPTARDRISFHYKRGRQEKTDAIKGPLE